MPRQDWRWRSLQPPTGAAQHVKAHVGRVRQTVVVNAALSICDRRGKKGVTMDEHSLDRQYANFNDGCIEDAAQRVESAQHIPQHRQPKICPRCGSGLSTESGFDVCNSCGYDGSDAGKLRAGA